MTDDLIEDDLEDVDIAAAKDYIELSRDERNARRLAKRPSIDHLEDATMTDEHGNLVPLIIPGDRVVVETYNMFAIEKSWLYTRVFTVKTIDSETMLAHCEREEMMHYACVSLNSVYQIVKKAPRIGDPFKVQKQKVMVVATDGSVVKRGRGRPKGTKNRPKELITAEHTEASQKRMLKAKRRNKR